MTRLQKNIDGYIFWPMDYEKKKLEYTLQINSLTLKELKEAKFRIEDELDNTKVKAINSIFPLATVFVSLFIANISILVPISFQAATIGINVKEILEVYTDFLFGPISYILIAVPCSFFILDIVMNIVRWNLNLRRKMKLKIINNKLLNLQRQGSQHTKQRVKVRKLVGNPKIT